MQGVRSHAARILDIDAEDPNTTSFRLGFYHYDFNLHTVSIDNSRHFTVADAVISKLLNNYETLLPTLSLSLLSRAKAARV
jgi:hypothetical protein